jgi:uncharacterized membrane protein YfcA
MIYIGIILAAVSLLASIIGAICGIGGGVIIKPVMDSMGVMSVETVSFLSGVTVLCMSGYSVFNAFHKKEISIKIKTGVPVSIGAVAGGIFGKYLFGIIKVGLENANFIGSIQAACLFVLTFGTLIYTINKQKLATYHISNSPICIIAGFTLGFFSSFLGIGGGPFNLVLLSFMFSMETKEAAQNSLFIIFFSQLSSLILIAVENKIPEFSVYILLGMALCGIAGAAIGRQINGKIKEGTVDKLFRGLNVAIMIICLYNFAKYN